MEDYRKADPSYVGFVPKTAAEAIDLFCRYRKLGVQPSQWPETFVHVCRDLPDPELDRFQEWLICPQGPATGPTYVPCPEIEAERKQLLQEAEARDRMADIDEDDEKLDEEMPPVPPLVRQRSEDCSTFGATGQIRAELDPDLRVGVADCSLEDGADTGE